MTEIEPQSIDTLEGFTKDDLIKIIISQKKLIKDLENQFQDDSEDW